MQASRRNLLKGGFFATMAAGVVSAVPGVAGAAETKPTGKEYDLVICGLGIGCIVTAIRAT